MACTKHHMACTKHDLAYTKYIDGISIENTMISQYNVINNKFLTIRSMTIAGMKHEGENNLQHDQLQQSQHAGKEGAEGRRLSRMTNQDG